MPGPALKPTEKARARLSKNLRMTLPHLRGGSRQPERGNGVDALISIDSSKAMVNEGNRTKFLRILAQELGHLGPRV